jgi:RNA polymerase sigma-70 factor, ECF subfamily
MADGLDGEALLDLYFEPVYAYVAYRVAPDRETASDITQEVFLAACRSAQTLRHADTALEWLRAIARAKVADHFRSAARRGQLAGAPETPARLPAANTPEAPRPRAVRAAQGSPVIRALPAEYAEALEHKYLEGLSVRDMAGQRGQTEKAVESMLGRAREAFRTTWRRIHGDTLPQGLEEEP